MKEKILESFFAVEIKVWWERKWSVSWYFAKNVQNTFSPPLHSAHNIGFIFDEVFCIPCTNFTFWTYQFYDDDVTRITYNFSRNWKTNMNFCETWQGQQNISNSIFAIFDSLTSNMSSLFAGSWEKSVFSNLLNHFIHAVASFYDTS